MADLPDFEALGLDDMLAALNARLDPTWWAARVTAHRPRRGRFTLDIYSNVEGDKGYLHEVEGGSVNEACGAAIEWSRANPFDPATMERGKR